VMTDDPLIVSWLEQQAQANAGAESTGVAHDRDVSVHYYPVSDRFTWFGRDGVITKREATKLLIAGKWSPPPPPSSRKGRDDA
jgi:hypothetical protein